MIKNKYLYIIILMISNFSISQVEVDTLKFKTFEDTLTAVKKDSIILKNETSIETGEIKNAKSTVYIDKTSQVKKYVVTQKNGEKLIGEIISDDGREMLLLTETIGKIYIAKNQIFSIAEYTLQSEPIETPKEIKSENKIQDENESFYLDSSTSVFSNKYLLNSNAFPLNKKENYSTIYLLGFDMHFAVSQRFSLGFTSTFIGSPLAITGKYSISKNVKKHIAFQVGFASSTFLLKGTAYAGMGKIIRTYGDRLNNISFSGGFEFVSNTSAQTFVSLTSRSSSKTYIPAISISIGGIKKIGEKTSFVLDSKITENRVTQKLTSISGYTAEGDVIYKVDELVNTNILLFPGIRFQKSESKAFQFNIGCYMNFHKNESKIFPFPSISWFRKL